jgi:hypothetical protein
VGGGEGGRKGGRSTTSKEEKNITRERNPSGLFFTTRSCSILPPCLSPSLTHSKVMNEKELWVLHFFFVFFFVAKFHHLITKKQEKKGRVGGRRTHSG